MKANEIYMRDPFVYVEGDTVYLVGTTDENAWGGKAHGFSAYTSRDLENFEGPYPLFERGESFWADENFWAPELHKAGGRYYLFASFKAAGKRRASQALVSDSPLGPFTPAEAPFTPADWDCLDATLYMEGDRAYTVFCHEWVQCRDGEMCLARLRKDFAGIEGAPRVLFRASEAPWTAAHRGGCYITDGPFLHRLGSGKLLMLWSSAGRKGYAMGMAVSEGGIGGPWRHIEEPLFAEDGGHGMVFRFRGKTYVCLHCPNEPHMSERPRFFEAEEREDRLVLLK